MVGILTVNFQSLSFLFFMHALCAHAQGSVDLHVESYGVAGPLVETLYRECPRVGRPLNMILPADLSMRAECMHEK